MNLCKDCKHCKEESSYVCSLEYEDPVNGYKSNCYYCHSCRSNEWACGADGKFFEPKHPEFVIPWDKLPQMAEWVYWHQTRWMWYEKEPFFSPCRTDVAYVDNGGWHGDVPGGILPPWPGDWRNSKMRRPTLTAPEDPRFPKSDFGTGG